MPPLPSPVLPIEAGGEPGPHPIVEGLAGAPRSPGDGPPAAAENPLRALRSSLAPHLLRSGRELLRARAEAPPDPPLPTAIPALDRLLEGGIPRGWLVELVGRRSSGRFSLALAALAAATAAGDAAALVDLGDGLDPRAAAGMGVALERLLWLRPRRLEEALAAAEAALAGGFPLVALDLGPLGGGVRSRAQPFWLRLARAAADHGGILLVTAPRRTSGPAAAAVLGLRREEPAWMGRGREPRLLAGLSARLTLEKARGAAPTAPAGRSEGLGLAIWDGGALTIRSTHPGPSTPSQRSVARDDTDGRQEAGGGSPLARPSAGTEADCFKPRRVRGEPRSCARS